MPVSYSLLSMSSPVTDISLDLYDFFINGDVHALDVANGIRSADVWFLLNDFSLILKTIITSFQNFMKLVPSSDMDMIDIQDEDEASDGNAGLKEVAKAVDNVLLSENGEAPAWEKDGEAGLMKVLSAFRKLEADFNTKFRAMWA